VLDELELMKAAKKANAILRKKPELNQVVRPRAFNCSSDEPANRRTDALRRFRLYLPDPLLAKEGLEEAAAIRFGKTLKVDNFLAVLLNPPPAFCICFSGAAGGGSKRRGGGRPARGAKS